MKIMKTQERVRNRKRQEGKIDGKIVRDRKRQEGEIEK
jgi:hypothetical protein